MFHWLLQRFHSYFLQSRTSLKRSYEGFRPHEQTWYGNCKVFLPFCLLDQTCIHSSADVTDVTARRHCPFYLCL